MKKQLLAVCLLLVGVLCLSGCGSSNVSEKQIEEDLAAEVDVTLIGIDYGSYFEERDLEVKDVVINKRQTNEKDDTVYCTVTMEDDWYQCSAEYVLIYNYYDQGGWILDDYYAEDQMITPLQGVPEECAESELNNYFFDTYELLDSSFDEAAWSAELTYHLTYNRKHVSVDDEATLYYYFSSEGNEGQWYPELYYDETNFQWDVLGDWIADRGTGTLANFSIEDVNLGSGEATINVTQSTDGFYTEGDITTECDMYFGDPLADWQNGTEESPYEEPQLRIGLFEMTNGKRESSNRRIVVYADTRADYAGEERNGNIDLEHGTFPIEKVS